jgi:hypothetical protein
VIASLSRQVQRRADLAALAGWSLLAGLMGPVPVVMGGVLAGDRLQVPFIANEHPVGAFGWCGAYPQLGMAVRTWGPRRGLYCLHVPAYQALIRAAADTAATRPGPDMDRISFTILLQTAADLVTTAASILPDGLDVTAVTGHVGDPDRLIRADTAAAKWASVSQRA